MSHGLTARIAHEEFARMIYSLAPMEGLTGSTFRAVHAECFGALDRYYTPFLAPPHVGSGFGKKALKELDPGRGAGLDVVPQLLTKNADEFVWAAQVLADMGFAEVNLNLGCPSGTVVAKGRGSGFLRDLDGLEAFLQDVCERSPLPVSVKTRLGIADDAEYERVLELYRRYPLAELIVHPRVQKDRLPGCAALGALWRDAGDGALPGGVQRRRLLRGRSRCAAGRLSRYAPCDAGARPVGEPGARAHDGGRPLGCSRRVARVPR